MTAIGGLAWRCLWNIYSLDCFPKFCSLTCFKHLGKAVKFYQASGIKTKLTVKLGSSGFDLTEDFIQFRWRPGWTEDGCF